MNHLERASLTAFSRCQGIWRRQGKQYTFCGTMSHFPIARLLTRTFSECCFYQDIFTQHNNTIKTSSDIWRPISAHPLEHSSVLRLPPLPHFRAPLRHTVYSWLDRNSFPQEQQTRGYKNNPDLRSSL
ncbi:hypothetical protein AOLI_G00204380 [Acnodon oligacanthus]